MVTVSSLHGKNKKYVELYTEDFIKKCQSTFVIYINI